MSRLYTEYFFGSKITADGDYSHEIKRHLLLGIKTMINLVTLITQSCPILWDTMDYSPLGSSVHGLLQAKILEWVAISFSRGSSQVRDREWFSCTAGRLFTHWAIRDAHDQPRQHIKKQRHYFANKGPFSQSYGYLFFYLGFPGGLDGKASACNAGDLGSIPDQEDPLRRKWQPTPVFLPGKSHGERSLVDYSLWGCKESDMTDSLTLLLRQVPFMKRR